MTDTSTVQSLIEDKNKPADDPPFATLDESENENGNARTQSDSFQDSNDILHTPRQSSFHNQNGNSSPTNIPPHNFAPNDHPPNQDNNDQPTFTYNNGPHQSITGASPGASPITPFSNKNSFNHNSQTNKDSYNNNSKTIIDNSGQVNFNIVCPGPFPRGWTVFKKGDTEDPGTGLSISIQEHESTPPLSHRVGVPFLS